MPKLTDQAPRRRDTREVLINVRARRQDRDLIDRAAGALGKNRTEFVLDAARREARSVLLDQCFFELDEARFRQFVQVLDRPPEARENLRRLMARKAPWA